MERLQKVIAQCGVCSRRKAEELILAKRVKVDGEIIDTLGYKVRGDQQIEIDGKVLNKEEKVTYIMNKPKNIITSVHDDKNRTTVIDLIDSDYRLFPIGRLDFDSSGLLFLTNDGDLANKMIHPKFMIPKVYEVTINDILKEEDRKKLETGIRVDDYISAPAKLKVLRVNQNKKTTLIKMTIYEGHNRQIRKMFERLGYLVIKLHRIEEANIQIGNLRPGEYRKLKPIEVVNLKKYLDKGNI